jgi:hypothetical protein
VAILAMLVAGCVPDYDMLRGTGATAVGEGDGSTPGAVDSGSPPLADAAPPPDASAVDASVSSGDAGANTPPTDVAIALPDRQASEDLALAPDAAPAPHDRAGDMAPPSPDLSAPDRPVDEAPGMWTPASLADLVVWLDATASGSVEVTAGKVSRWTDRSGRANHAVQAMPSMRPSLDPTGMNGRPTITFAFPTPIYLQIPDGPDLQWGTGDFLLAVVAKGTNPQNDFATLYHKEAYFAGDFRGPAMFLPFGGEAQIGFKLLAAEPLGAAQNRFFNDGRPFMAVVRHLGTKLEIRGDGVPASRTITVVDVSMPGRDVHIGAEPESNNQQLRGGISEMVAARGAVSDDDVAALEAYFKKKYGL